MTKQQFETEKSYQISIKLVEELHAQGILDDEEFEKVKEVLIERYKPVLGSLILL